MTKPTMSSSCVVVGEITGNKWNHTKTRSVVNQETRRNVEDIYRIFDIDMTSRINKRTIKKFLDM